ncbi:MAG: hypothetical protein N2595_06735 [bacterium]|nr:hypothetical protein [bacterium]
MRTNRTELTLGRVKGTTLFAVGLGVLASALARANPLPVQTYYVPLKEAHVYAACAALGHIQATNQNNIISIVANSSNTLVYYDHWEDGYELDIAHPAQATTLVFGDNNVSNGIPPGFSNDVINAGGIVALSSVVNVLVTNPAVIRYDGGDKIGVSRPVAVTYSSWALDPGPVLADGLEVYDTTKFGTNFFAPVGTNVGTGGHFEYASLHVMAAHDNTLVQIDADANGTFETSVTLHEGQAHHVNGGVLRGARVRTSKPVQVGMITGDIGVNYEMRWYALYSREFWSSSYFTPVGQTRTGVPVSVWLYNQQAAPVAVQVTAVGTQSVVNVPAGGNFEYIMPGDTGARFVSTNGAAFSAVLVVDSDADGASYDWGSSLVPGELLTPEALNGWGPGSSTLTVNGSPVWVMAFTTAVLFVDYDGNPQTGPFTDGLGRKYDTNIAVTAFQSRRIYDPSGDNDQTGVRVYTTNNVTIVAMWGQDAGIAGSGNPYLDIGTAILPIPNYSGVKSATPTNEFDHDGRIDPGEELLYTILIRNEGMSPMLNVWVQDALPSNVTYVAGSTRSNDAAMADSGATPFPLDEGGKGFGTLAIGAELRITYRVVVTNPFPLTTAPLLNRVTVSMTGGGVFLFHNETPVQQADLGISKSASTAAPPLGGTVVFSITVTNRGPWQATGVTVHDALPAGLVYLSHSGGSYAPGSGIWNVGTLAAGASATLTIVAQVATTQAVTNIARQTQVDQHDPTPDTNTLPVVVLAQPVMVDITNAPVTVTFDVTSYVIGGTNVNVVGGMSVSNATAGGAALAFGASSPWVAPAIGLVTGANTLVVRGTNSAGYLVWDSVVITRGGVGTGAPLVDITNAAHAVSYDISSRAVGGTNNQHVVGGMWVSNATVGGAALAFPAAPAWITPAVTLAVGANTLVVYGTNALGVLAQDTVVITRGPIGSGVPFVDITNTAPTVVSNPVTSVVLGGTNNIHVIGGMWWSNMTTGVSGPLARNSASNAWTGTFGGLAVGANTLRAYGSNLAGTVVFDMYVITRLDEGSNPPFVDITNAPHLLIPFGTPSTMIGGTNYNVVGTMWWSNETTGVGGTFAAMTPWTLTLSNLAIGVNVIRVYGTNEYGSVAFDSVPINQGGPGTGTPFTDITNAALAVTFDVTSFAPAGTNNLNVVGGQWASNATAGGAALVFPASTSYVAPALPLEVGANTLVVYGTNKFGAQSSDSVVITRGPAGTGVPFVDITNPPTWVTYDETSFAVAGTNNANVVGTMFVSNATVGGVRLAFAAGASWTAPAIGLAIGANTLVVYGSNAYGVVVSDSVVITRGPAGTGTPFVDVTNAPVWVSYDVTSYAVAGTNNLNVVGGQWVSNSANGDVEVFAAADEWTTPALALSVGANPITVYGSNAFGVVVSDSVVITRGAAGTGAPFVDITTTPFTVTFDSAAVAVSGTNNANVVGGMWVTNQTAGGAAVSFAASAAWTTPLIALAVGANTLHVYGTNAFGVQASDSVVVTRGGVGTGMPFIIITNDGPIIVSNAVVAVTIGGTNNMHVVDVWWENATVNAGGPVVRSLDGLAYEALITPLTVGVNHVHVNGSNALGVTVFDHINIVRLAEDTNPPFVDITNQLLTFVTYDVTSAEIGGTNYNVVGGMWWTNTATGAGGEFPATTPWTLTIPNLAVGINAIYVYGTNAHGSLASDFTGIQRGGPGTGVPLVFITNPQAWVSYDVTSYTLAGTNNPNVVHGMRTANAATFEIYHFAGGPAWTAPSVSLAVGPNTLWVYGTNIFGEQATDTIVVERGPAGTGAPFLDITNEPAAVPYETTLYCVAGTNNPNVVGDQWVSNSAIGIVIPFPASVAWQAPCMPLSVGTNVIIVTGTNAFGVEVRDELVIVRKAAGTGLPFVDITNTVQQVPYEVMTFAVAGTNNSHVVGTMQVSNLANGAAAFFPAAPSWTAPPLPLVPGLNIIAVYGTNTLGVVASDAIAFVHFGPCSIIPDVVITNAVPFVPFDVASYAIAGTNNISVTGSMHIINVHVSAEATFPATPVWTAPSLPLRVGSNTFYVRGSNVLGVIDIDVATVVRGAPGTGAPFLAITTTPHSVYSNVEAVSVAGTNNPNVVGGMWVSNAANGSVATFAAAPAWLTPPVPLHPGANTLHVYGSNAYGVIVSDTIVITQLDHALTITITAPNNGNDYSVMGGAHSTNVTGLVSLVPEVLHWSNLLTGASGVLQNHTQFAFPAWLALGTNVIRVTAHTANGSAMAQIRIIVRAAAEPSTRVLCVWPHLIGATQTGMVEFVSTQASVYSILVMTASGSVTIATGTCSEDWNVVPFYGGALPAGIGQGTNTLYLKVADEEPVYAASVLVVPDLQLGQGVTNYDLDGDLISISYKPAGGGQIRAQGRTLFISGGAPKDKLSVKVKAVQKGTDRSARICGVFTDGGFGSVQVAGSLDRFEADGAVKKLRLRNGSLGQPCLTRLNFVRFASAAGKSAVQIKGGGLRANVLIGTQTPGGQVATRGALKTLAVSGGDIGSPLGRRWLQASSIGTLVAKGSKRRGGVLSDYSLYLTGETKQGSGVSIGKMMVFAMADTSGAGTNVTIVCGHDPALNPLQQPTWPGVPVQHTLGALSVRGGLSEGTIVVDRLPEKLALPGMNKVKWIVNGE